MKKLLLLSLVSAFLFAISSCTITKRHFRPGYHVEWNKKEKTEKETLTSTKTETKTETLAKTEVEKVAKTEVKTLAKTKRLTPEESKSEGAVEETVAKVVLQEEDNAEVIVSSESEINKVLKSVESRDPKSDDSDYILRIILGVVLVIFVGPMFLLFGVLLFLLMLLAFESVTISNNYALTEAIAVGLGGALMVAYYATGFYLIFKLFSRKEMDPERFRDRRNLQWIIAFISALFLSALLVLGVFFA